MATPPPSSAAPRAPAHPPRERRPVGWREWVALPGLGVAHVKAKVDTGARTSSLHAFDVERFRRRGRDWVRFCVHPIQRDTRTTIVAEVPVLEMRPVRSSSGHTTLRPVIVTDIEVLGERWPIELTLAARDEMGFRMLLGRQALRGRFVVDPGRSFVGGRPGRGKKKRRVRKGTKAKGSQA